MEKKYQRLWDRKTFACIGLSVALSTGFALSVCAAKHDTSAQQPTPSVSQSHTDASTAVLQAEGR